MPADPTPHHGPGLQAVLIDIDGIVPETTPAQLAAQKALFDAVLHARNPDASPLPAEHLLAANPHRPDDLGSTPAPRSTARPDGPPDRPADSPDRQTSPAAATASLTAPPATAPVEVPQGTRALLDDLAAAGLPAAAVSTRRNAHAVLTGADPLPRLAALFDRPATDQPDQPDPALLLRAAAALGVAPERAAVILASAAAARAARAAGFAQVLGIDPDGAGRLSGAGAAPVVADPAELQLAPGPRLAQRRLSTLPHLRDARDALATRLQGRRLAVFLDHDGTLTPIVARPEDATLSAPMRHALRTLAARVPVAILSGRDLTDVQALVGEAGLHYAGSHGFDLAGPDGWRASVAGDSIRPALAAAAGALETALAPFPGARLERKRFALAVHFRAIDPGREADLATTLRTTLADHPALTLSTGKKVVDIRPRIDWHKGRALVALLARLGLDGPETLPLHIGDDTTDEDAFRSLARRGLGVVVRDGSDRPTAARLALDSVAEVEEFLLWLAGQAR